MLTSGDVNGHPMRRHADFVARLGHHAHGLVFYRKGWCFGVWAGVTAKWYTFCPVRSGWWIGLRDGCCEVVILGTISDPHSSMKFGIHGPDFQDKIDS